MATADNALPELVPTARALSRADKLRLIQILAVDLAREQGIPLMEAGASYPIWSPLGAVGAASVLLRELQTDK